ncbi:hypothetical protein GO755_32725 [Spirosoma sp. HMF4905]|uniref:Phage-Barnase-EndoU-ColicinE5/D-RelE like nuclease 2 domain-containing protein n=1 Tax=Spirosoma arboris TaxID=2682092 RepID=A0A7K1SM09_9BACT|nr:hypothetical protein [Spirosoma arboris]MVM34839.1 hypothetical protein [Spirosoma arboris]
MNHHPKNKAIYTDQGRAEIFFQTVNLDHYLEKYLLDLNKPDDKRFHRLSFSEITKVLNQGNVLIEKYADAKKKYYAISRYEGRYYYAVFYLGKREDCDKLFAIIVTCYATNNKDIHQRWERHDKNLKGKFGQ